MTTLEQIRALALQGVGMRGVEATIGRPLTAEERTTYDRAATVRRLKAVADQRAARTEREAKAKAAADARAARKRERELALIAAAPKPADGEKAAYITRKVLGEALAARVITAAEFDLAAAPDARSQRNSIPVRAIHAKIRYWQDRRERRERAAQTNADRKAASVSRRYNITEIPPVADPARRRRCERSALFFLRHYCTACRGGFLATPVPAQMRGIVHAMQRCIETGVPYHIRMPRGLGKTSIMKGVVLWALATGRAHFVESAAATRDKATGIITDIWNCMQRSPDFKADFPEISAFMERTRGNPRTAPSIMWQGKAAGLQKSADGFHLPRIEIDSKPTPSSGAIMKAFGFSAAVRGEVEGDMRPDIIIFDDLQDRELASSPARVQEAIRTLDADFLGGTSHTKITGALMTSTPIKPDDLSEHYAADPFWRTETFKLVKHWPDCFDPTSDEGLWWEFWRIWERENSLYNRDPHPACNAFYEAHRAEMDAGAEVLNPRAFSPNEVSAIEHAMILYFSKGAEVFDAEYQMSPHRNAAVVAISPQLILSRVVPGLPAITPPADTVMVCAHTDINPSYALTTTVVAFDGYRSPTVVDHFIHRVNIPGDAHDAEFLAEVYAAIIDVGRKLAERGHAVKSPNFHWGVDAAGNQRAAVLDAWFRASPVLGFRPLPMVGIAQQRFNPRTSSRKIKLTPGRNGTVLCWNQNAADPREWINYDKDGFQEAAHLAWTRAPGAPGAARLFAVWGDRPADHEEFAIQVAGERLRSKTPARNRSTGEDCHIFDWETVSERHDYGDNCYGCFALAAFYGLVPSATPVAAAQAKPRKIYINGVAV